MGLLDYLLGFLNLEASPIGTKDDLTACIVSESHLQSELAGANSKLSTANGALDSCQQDGTVQQKTIAQQAATIQELNDQVVFLNTRLASVPGSIFSVPCPAFLEQADPKKVMLGQFTVTSKLGTTYITYPVHSAVFQPCPFFENILNAAGCNRRRDDLTEIQIATLIGNIFQRGEKYRTDQAQWGILDNWSPAILVYLLGGDDCESEAAAIASAIIYYQMKFGIFKNYFVTLGLGHLKVGTEQLGHGFVCLWHYTSTDVKDSYVIEATLEYAADAKSLSDAKNDYMIDWGVIGYARADYSEGAYAVKDSMAWWGAISQAIGYKKEYGKVQRLKRFILRQPDPKKVKHKHLQKIWENKRRNI